MLVIPDFRAKRNKSWEAQKIRTLLHNARFPLPFISNEVLAHGENIVVKIIIEACIYNALDYPRNIIEFLCAL